jgi:ketosteroid isomerase-like protein
MSGSRTGILFTVALTIGLLVIPAASPRLAAADSAAEEAVKTEIKNFAAARNAADVDRVLSHVADDAKLTSFAGKDIAKADYREAVKANIAKYPNLERTYRVVEMTFPDATHAVTLVEQSEFVTEGKGTFGAKTKVVETNRLRWTFEKRGERWLIVGQKWMK